MNKDRVRGGRRGYLDTKKENTPYFARPSRIRAAYPFLCVTL
jgi:hypothetical protein